MQQGSTSPMKYVSSTQRNPLIVVPISERISHISRHSERTNKREFSDAMDTDHKDNTTSKKQKVESEGELMKVTKTKEIRNK